MINISNRAFGVLILNLTQHPASPEQLAAGVIDISERDLLAKLLTFDDLPSTMDIHHRATDIVHLAHGYRVARPADMRLSAMIGGALWLMAPLADALRVVGIEPLFAFSRRESAESTGPDGTVRKTAIFRHIGFVPAL